MLNWFKMIDKRTWLIFGVTAGIILITASSLFYLQKTGKIKIGADTIVPTITTLGATNVTGNSAIFNGTVDQSVDQVGFEHGLDSSKGNCTTVTILEIHQGSRTSYDFSQEVSDLNLSDFYCYRAVGSYNNSRILGKWISFRTSSLRVPSELPILTTKAASNISETAATLHGSLENRDAFMGVLNTISDDEEISSRSSVGFEYYVDISQAHNCLNIDSSSIKLISTTSIANSANFSDNISGLSPGTYYCAVSTINVVGNDKVVSALWTSNPTSFKTLGIQVDSSVTTLPANNIGSTNATLNGKSTGDDIAVNGFAYGIDDSEGKCTSHLITNTFTAGSGAGNFSSNITDLIGSTNYCYVAFIRPLAGDTIYGKDWVSFKTSVDQNAKLPTVQTLDPTNITDTRVTLNGKIITDGNSAISQVGFELDTNKDAYAHRKIYATIGGSTTFSKTDANQKAGTTYYVRAFAINSVAIGYGEWVQFTTTGAGGTITPTPTPNSTSPAAGVPTVSTLTPTNITTSGFEPKGIITADGGTTIVERGFEYGYMVAGAASLQNPTTVSDKGSFTKGAYGKYPAVSNGLAGAKYKIRAFAKNSAGIGYGDWVFFNLLGGTGATTPTPTSKISVPTVRTFAPTVLGSTFATFQGIIDSTGGATITRRGFQYRKSIAATNTIYDNGSFGTGIFNKSTSGLSKDSIYYVRAYATNSAGTGYGSWLAIKTQ